MNWGKGIAIVLATFMVFIIVLAVILMRQNVDLVSDDYYKKEINYEEEISAIRNANELESRIEIQQNDKHIVVKLPDNIDMSEVSILFQRPDNNQLDKKFVITDTKSYLIDKNELAKGTYLLEINYLVGGKNCMQKEKIYI